MSSAERNKQKLPDGWVLCQSKSIPGRTYYFNKKTGKSSWSQPQAHDKSDPKMSKKDKIRKAEKRKKEELLKKCVKRKNDGHEESTSKKRPKQASDKWENFARKESNTHKLNKKRGTPSKSTGNSSFKSSPPKKESPLKQSPIKNLANSRMSLLREQLANEVNEESESVSPSKKAKGNPIMVPCDVQESKIENKIPSNDLKSSQSPTNESVQSSPSPSQFFAANKIISSMKAQLPDEYFNIDKQKDTFADIEKGICSQMPEYPSLKHPATPPQFSEATKLMSAIKSKLTYKGSPKESEKSFTSAKDRMEQLRANLSSDLSDADLNISRRTEVSESNSIVEAMEVEDVNEVNPTEKSAVQKDIIKGADLVVVVDTNIFIHELELIKNVLNSHIKGYSEQPTLLVPWRVINELDRLKDNNNGNGALCKRAKAAMDYLYKSLPENSRIVGQSLRDANSHIYPCEIPDDEILNCSLQQVERGKNVILLSNDKNLCNKATINNVRHINVSKLRGMLEHRDQGTDPELATTVKHYQQTMYQLLANILENEMRAKYNNLWQHVLFKPPPWSLNNVLQCLLKHWIAVFNEVFPRIEHILKDLQCSLTSLEKKDQNTLTHSEVANFKELCVDVSKRCQIIPEYMELAKRTMERLLGGPGLVEPGGDLVRSFEGLWTVLSGYCAKLCSALALPHNMEDNTPGSEPLAVLVSKWSHINGQLTEVTSAIQDVLSVESPLEEHLQRLEASFNKALSSFCMDSPVSREQLRLFSTNCRNMLEEAHTKFTQLVELLNVCKNSFSQTN